MSKNETLTQTEEQRLNLVFSRLKEVHLEAPLYLKTRVLAHLETDAKQIKSLFFWKVLSLSSLASLALVIFFGISLLKKNNSADVFAKQAYVIHVDFNQMDQQQVAEAEIELPEDVRFVSSNKDVQRERRLKLPVSVKNLGRGKLPFVVTSDFSGEKAIKVRLLNEKDELVREQILRVKFAKEGSAILF